MTVSVCNFEIQKSRKRMKMTRLDRQLKLFNCKVVLIIIIMCNMMCTTLGQQPKLQTSPQDKTEATEGESIKLMCIVKNLGRYNVSWLRNDTRITNNDNIIIDSLHYRLEINKEFGDYHLRIMKIKRSDANWAYKCAVYNEAVLLVTHPNPAVISVAQIPIDKYPICDSISKGYLEKTRIEVNCRAEIVKPNVQIQWRKNGILVDQSKTTTTRKNGEVILKYSFIAEQRDSGASLKCSMYIGPTNSMRNCTQGPLNIQFKPNVSIHEPEIVFVGKEAVYICRATGNPEINEYTWNLTDIPKDRYVNEQGDQILRITPMLKDNMTTISCTATNKIDSVTKYIKLRLNESKKTTHQLPDYEPNVTYKSDVSNNAISLFAIVLVAVGCSSLILLLMVIPVCYYYTCQRHEEGLYMPRLPPLMVQPDLYSEPKDMTFSADPNQNRTLPLLPSGTIYGKWKRSVGVQVPTEIEIEDVYAHVEGEPGLHTSKVRSTKSEYV